jgi:hypothetical protein
MKTNPPAAEDAPWSPRWAQLVSFQDRTSIPANPAFDSEAIKAAPKVAQAKIMEYFKMPSTPINGWMFSTKTVTRYLAT